MQTGLSSGALGDFMAGKDTCSFKIALLPGDGIGPEVLEAAITVLKGVESCLKEVRFQFEEFSVGAKEYLARNRSAEKAVAHP